MPRIRSMSLKDIGLYYNTAHFLRPIQPSIVERYARDMNDGAKFPNLILGTYPGQDGKKARLIVDGNHIYRACQVAKLTSFSCEFVSYDSLGDALADQLKRNLTHGYQISAAQRDARVRQLIEVYNWSVRQVAQVVGIHFSSVSRINRKTQNVSGTGKPGAMTDKKAKANQPGPYNPKQFLRALESVSLTLKDTKARAAAFLEVYSPKRDPKEVQRIVAMLQGLLEDLGDLVQKPAVVPRPVRALKPTQEHAAVAA
jgi:ParB-like chromosome segregation protein Spo0J